MATSSQVEQVRVQLGVGTGSQVITWLATAIDYFQDVLGVDPLDSQHLQYIRGIDFHRPISVVMLFPGTMLVRFPEITGGMVKPEVKKPYRFFATPGSTPLRLGWNPDQAGFHLFRLCQPARALVSHASAIRFGESRAARLRDHGNRPGGDRQVVVPWETFVEPIRERDFDKVAEMFRAASRVSGLPQG